MRSGQVVQMKPVVAAIRAAAEEAELMAKLPVEKVIASVAGIFVSGRLTRAAIVMGAREREVTLADLETLHDAVRRQPLPAGHTVLNVVSPIYALDDQDGSWTRRRWSAGTWRRMPTCWRARRTLSELSRRRSTNRGSKSRSSSSHRSRPPTLL